MFNSYNASCDKCGYAVRLGEPCAICSSNYEGETASDSPVATGEVFGGPITLNGFILGAACGIAFCVLALNLFG